MISLIRYEADADALGLCMVIKYNFIRCWNLKFKLLLMCLCCFTLRSLALLDLSQLLKFIFYANSFATHIIFFPASEIININCNACIFAFSPLSTVISLSLFSSAYTYIKNYSSPRVIACDTEMSMQKRVFADEWWKYNWNINRIFHTSRDLPKAIIAALFAFINVFFRTERSWTSWQSDRERKLMLLRSDWLTHSFKLTWRKGFDRSW